MSAQTRRLEWCVTHGAHLLYIESGLCDFASQYQFRGAIDSCEAVPAVLVTDITSGGRWTGRRLSIAHQDDAVCIR